MTASEPPDGTSLGMTKSGAGTLTLNGITHGNDVTAKFVPGQANQTSVISANLSLADSVVATGGRTVSAETGATLLITGAIGSASNAVQLEKKGAGPARYRKQIVYMKRCDPQKPRETLHSFARRLGEFAQSFHGEGRALA